MNHRAYLLLGANLGDRMENLRRATERIAERIGSVAQASPVYETAPWGVTDQPAYLNQVLAVDTELLPDQLLDQTQRIEQELGRVRLERWGARLIDVDILFYDDLVYQTDRLTLPHPRLHERRFTLIPLADIAPDLLHPVLHKTIRTLLADCPDEGDVLIFNK